jgi:membrane fusion protein, hemolysin D
MIKKYYERFLEKLEGPEKIQRDQLAFLPAALEIQDTPPSPIGRAIIWTLVLLFCIAVVWTALGKIDIVAVATGKVIPSGRVKTIQPLEIGVVAAIHVEEGQSVKKGDPLITLDGTQTQADEKRLADELHSAQIEWLRTSAFQKALEAGEAQLSPLTLVQGAMIQEAMQQMAIAIAPQDATFQSRLLQAQFDEYQSRRKSLEGQVRAREAERRQAQSLKRKLERTLPLISERADSVKTLYQKQLASREQHLALEQERITQEQDFLAESARVDELTGEIQAIQDQVATVESEYKRNNLIALQEAKQKTTALEQEWIKARQRNRQQVLHASTDGTVQQLSVHTIGGVVTPAQDLMLIVPEDSQLEVEAFIQNKDIGFVAEGQAAEVKIDTFNFTKYGLIDAQLKTISHDAVSDENLGLVYPARVILEQAKIQIADKWVNLSPGMSVTVEVKTGKRRIIEFFLSPLLRYKQESIRER